MDGSYLSQRDKVVVDGAAGLGVGVIAQRHGLGKTTVRRWLRQAGIQGKPGGEEWTPEQDAQLRRLWDEGFSGGMLSAEIEGKSRNACLSRALRLGLPPREPTVRRTNASRAAASRARRARAAQNTDESEIAISAVVDDAASDRPLRVSVPLTASQDPVPGRCLFITGDGADWSYCHLPSDEPLSSWCGAHRKRVFWCSPVTPDAEGVSSALSSIHPL